MDKEELKKQIIEKCKEITNLIDTSTNDNNLGIFHLKDGRVLEITKVVQKDKPFTELEIPDGWRLLTLSEAVELVNIDDFIEWTKFDNEENDFIIEQPFKKNKVKRVAYIGYDCDNGLYLTSDYPGCYSPKKGAIFCREVERFS